MNIFNQTPYILKEGETLISAIGIENFVVNAGERPLLEMVPDSLRISSISGSQLYSAAFRPKPSLIKKV